jgi:hypothetical protein
MLTALWKKELSIQGKTVPVDDNTPTDYINLNKQKLIVFKKVKK